jgi:formylglycine-generating enzyme required for sulfatase activity
VKYVVFPGEPHGPRKLTHQVRKVEEEVAWFDKYFFKTAKPEDEAVRKDAPFAAALRAKNVARSRDGIGTTLTKKNTAVLIPEVVKRDTLEIGRFEVTRAQFRSMLFTPIPGEKPLEDSPGLPYGEELKYPTTPYTANYPASVTFAEAQIFVGILAKRTGEAWRIPYEDEVKALYENRDGENTLDYWAGYAPNPEDTRKLREKAKELGGRAPLLKEVGSFAGKGREDEEPIYDLGGNVAEWVLTRDGKGQVIGGSADCPADPKANCTAAPEYVGFRVVRGAAKPAAQ